MMDRSHCRILSYAEWNIYGDRVFDSLGTVKMRMLVSLILP